MAVETKRLNETTEALINEALKLARGDWQRHMIKNGYDRLKGVAAYYAPRYRKSLWSVVGRLKAAGFKVTIFQPDIFSFYLVIGDPWVNWIEATQSLRDEIIVTRERVRAVAEKSPRLRKELSRHCILQSLKNLQEETFFSIWCIAGYYADYLDCVFGKEGDAHEYLERARKAVEQAEQRWHEFWSKTKTLLGIALL